MTDHSQPLDIRDAVERHAEAILRSAGTSLRNYEMPGNRARILNAVMAGFGEVIEECARVAMAYREWSDWTGDTFPDEPGTSIGAMLYHARQQLENGAKP